MYALVRGKLLPVHSFTYFLPTTFQKVNGLNVCVSPGCSSYVEILILKAMAFGGGAFGTSLGHESRAFMNGISVVIRKVQKGSES